ncbi:MAG TPA: ATPase P, partial [Clostridiales bacterium]|nr:ATPase P [Clostridiales bacterium]
MGANEIQWSEEPERILASAQEGLTREQAQRRMEGGLANTPVTAPSKTVGQIVKSNLLTYFNLIFAILAVLVFASGSLRNLTFLPVVFANLFIGILQEIRAKKTLDKLTMLSAPRAEVIREGQIQEIPAEELVLDDIVIFQAGDQICADAIILDGQVLVNEALLTGEADELKKGLGDFLMSGSFLVSGECTARLERVGAESYISQLTLEAKATDTKQRSEMLRTLDKLVGVVGILIVPIGVFLFVQQYVLSGATFRDSILSMVAAVIGMIPEGLYLLTSVALVVSVLRLASRKVLVHDMKCIEALARVDVLCVDKTGTITENEMQVSSLIPLEGFDPAQGVGLKTLVGNLVTAMPEGNQTMQALHRYFRLPAQGSAEQVFPFSSTYKYCGAVFPEGAYVLGAPEFLLREDYEALRPLAESFGGDGYRVMLFGRYTGTLEGQALTEKVIPLGLILLTN